MIVVVGAGIAGLSLAWELTRAGADVTVLEANAIAAGASGAATSYLEPRLGTTAMRKFEWRSFALWPQWAGELQQASGIDLDFQQRGQLRLGLKADLAKYEKDIARREAEGWKLDRISVREALELEPTLSSEIEAAAFLPDICWVDGQKVCAALAHAIKDAGGKVLFPWKVKSLARENENASDDITLKSDSGEELKCKQVVFATGMGGNEIEGLPRDLGVCRPVRGVNLVLDMGSWRRPIVHHIKHHRGNACPRGDNKLFVGTTYEPGQTDVSVGENVIEMLYANIEPVVPDIRKLRLAGIMSGVRSKIGDGKLHAGCSVERQNIFYSLSHSGAGFLRAPLVAQEMARFVMTGGEGNLFPSAS